MPRWAPPRRAPSAETCAPCRTPAAALAVEAPDAAQKEGLSSEALGSASGAAEPAVGTPDGGFPLRSRPVPPACPGPRGTGDGP